MLTDEKPEIYLKRRRLALDYFQHIPARKVRLADFSYGPDDDLFLEAIGLDALKCNAVACLAGWLWTLPEYRDWAKMAQEEIACDVVLARWLGLEPLAMPWHLHDTFSTRFQNETGSDKAVALARLDGLIQEAEEACR